MKSSMIAKNALESTLAKLETHNAMIHERLFSEISQELALIAELNGGAEPTVDRLYRLHAPYDGYISEDEHAYLKGQFIPSSSVSDIVSNCISEFFGNKKDKPNVKRLLVNKDIADEVFLIAHDNGIIKVNMGKSFKNGDVESCYLYTEGPKFLVNHFLGEIESLSTEIKKLEGTAPIGRVQVTGVITSLKDSFDEVYNTYNKKVRILLNNDSSCYGNLSKAFIDKVKVGDEITFTATFKPSESESHAYLGRMSKLSVLRLSEEVELENSFVNA